jgi:hypothetical protein
MAKNIVKRLTEQLQAKGMTEGKANAVAVKRMQAAGNVKPGSSELTPQGKKRSEMGAAGRAKDRAAKYSGRAPEQFTYSSKTNRARVKGTA